MPIRTFPGFRELALLCRALGNERRLFILTLLASGPLTCVEIAEKLGINKMAASKHLHKLLRVGLIVGKRKGGAVEFRLTSDFRKRLQSIVYQLPYR